MFNFENLISIKKDSPFLWLFLFFLIACYFVFKLDGISGKEKLWIILSLSFLYVVVFSVLFLTKIFKKSDEMEYKEKQFEKDKKELKNKLKNALEESEKWKR